MMCHRFAVLLSLYLLSPIFGPFKEQLRYKTGLSVRQTMLTTKAGNAQTVHAAPPSLPSALAERGKRRLALFVSGASE